MKESHVTAHCLKRSFVIHPPLQWYKLVVLMELNTNKVQSPLTMKMSHLYLTMHGGLFELDNQPVDLCPSVCFMFIRTQIKSHLRPVIICHSQMCTVPVWCWSFVWPADKCMIGFSMKPPCSIVICLCIFTLKLHLSEANTFTKVVCRCWIKCVGI